MKDLKELFQDATESIKEINRLRIQHRGDLWIIKALSVIDRTANLLLENDSKAISVIELLDLPLDVNNEHIYSELQKLDCCLACIGDQFRTFSFHHSYGTFTVMLTVN